MGLRVCIVTNEFVGPFRNGGIGTAYTCLADLLAEAGHEVAVAYVGPHEGGPEMIRHWRTHYTEKKINFINLRLELNVTLGDATPSRALSYKIFSWLRQQAMKFDIVHVADCGGLGYYSLLAKHLGVEFGGTTFLVGMHGPTLWARNGNSDPVVGRDLLDLFFLEAESVRLADLVVSPSRYLVQWAQGEGWQLPPNRTLVMPNVIAAPSTTALAHAKRPPVSELVFFGRLEERKGLGGSATPWTAWPRGCCGPSRSPSSAKGWWCAAGRRRSSSPTGPPPGTRPTPWCPTRTATARSPTLPSPVAWP